MRKVQVDGRQTKAEEIGECDEMPVIGLMPVCLRPLNSFGRLKESQSVFRS